MREAFFLHIFIAGYNVYIYNPIIFPLFDSFYIGTYIYRMFALTTFSFKFLERGIFRNIKTILCLCACVYYVFI